MAGKLNTELVRRRRQEINKQEDDRKKGMFWDKLEPGPNRRRILPPLKDGGDWRRKYGMHYNILEGDSVLCPKITFDQPCPICEANENLFKTKDAENKEFAKKIRGKETFCTNVLNLDKNDGKVYIMDFGINVEKDIVNIIDPGDSVDKDGKPLESFGYGDITDPKTGRNLLITKTIPADKQQTKYEVKASTQSSEVANWAEVDKQIHDLDEHVKTKQIYSYDDLVAMMDGTFKPKDTPVSTPKDMPKTETPVTSKPQVDEFGQPVKGNPVKEVTDEFTKPTGSPVVTVVQTQAEAAKVSEVKPVENTQPAKAMSAIERLKAMKAAKG